MSCAGVVPFEYFNFDFICPLISFTSLIEDELNGQTISSGDKIWRKLPLSIFTGSHVIEVFNVFYSFAEILC